MKTFLNIVLVLAIIILFAFILGKGIEKQERVTCETLAKQAATYPGWYATTNEREMCDALGMGLPPDNSVYPAGYYVK